MLVYAAAQDDGRRDALRKLGRLVPVKLLSASPANAAVGTTYEAGSAAATNDAQNTCAEGPFDALDEAA